MTQTDWNADLYADKHAFVWKHGSNVVDLLEPQAGERILDLGCGTGELSAKMASSGAHVTGLDASSAMIERARTQFSKLEHPNLEFTVQSATEMSFEAQFDAIFSNAALHWIQPAEKAAVNMAKALKPGGRLTLEMGGYGNVQAIVEALEQVLGAERVALENPWYFPSLGQYAALLEAHGLRVSLAQLFKRPTPLEEGVNGLKIWLEQFGGRLLGGVPLERRAEVLARVEDAARARLWDGEKWVADYVRLRMVAKRETIYHPSSAIG